MHSKAVKGWVTLGGVLVATTAVAQGVQELETIQVIGTTPTHGIGLPPEKIAATVQTATSEDFQRGQSLDLPDFMNRNLGSVNINMAQNNPLQPDVQYRGFTASPLLGLPQGLAIYQNGVRINEPFGDTVNWDLLPTSAIDSINLIGGANPLFGQNTLGGALSVQMKNGFSFEGHGAEVYGGAFDRVGLTGETGGNNGQVGYYLNVDYFDETGWRDYSESDALNFYGALSLRSEASTLDLGVAHGDTTLRGNGPAPAELLAVDRAGLFTVPDITENDSFMWTAEGTHWLGEAVQLAGNAFYRTLQTDSFNGDSTPYEECDDGAGNEFLVEDFTDADGDGACNLGLGDIVAAGDTVLDQNGAQVDGDFDAVNNISTRDQESYGLSGQSTFLQPLFGRENQFIVGAAYNQGVADFDSQVEVAQLVNQTPTFGGETSRSGLFVPGDVTQFSSRTRTWSIYLTDTLALTDRLDLTVSGRFNSTRVVVRDRSGQRPDLNGGHDYDRFNPAVGATFQLVPAVNVYASYSEASRAPTPVELACADATQPCTLPNAFLADPPLEQVVARSVEAGARGEASLGGPVAWRLGVFTTTNEDDIIFQSTGGATSNQGFFDNVGDTRRRGVEVGLSGRYQRLGWFLNYSFVEATFQDNFLVRSPNHPAADGNGDTPVSDGNRIPGIPEHNLKIGGDYAFTERLTVGLDVMFNSDQHLRGDESNLLDTVDGYAIVDLRGEYRITDRIAAFAKVENLFDTDYETFGLLGDPTEVAPFAGYTDPRFFGAGAPIGGWVGVRIRL